MRYELTLTGLTPLLQANAQELLLPKVTKQRGASDPPPAEKAAMLAYKLRSGEYGHPTAAFRAAFLSAAGRYKIGMRGAASFLAGALDLEPADLAILLNPQTMKATSEYTVDIRTIVNRTTKARLPAAKPRWDAWAVKLIADIDEAVFGVEHEDLLMQIFEFAGKGIGVGSGRPELKKLSFGKFAVEAKRLD